MSGIAGIIHFDGKPVESGLIQKMTSAMAHRGPDGINHWVRGSVALAQCMLRTTPESLDEHQPLTNQDGSLVLVMDGRVDNWEALRKDLLSRGAKLHTRADAELVLRAYETWGRDCLAQIDGDFALVVWDAPRQEAFCARDRMGNKPFNYYWDGKTLAFASELHAILALPWVPESPNEGMLAEFLANEWYSRDETFWRGIRRLVAAHRLVADASGPRLEQYWEPDLWATLPYSNDDDYADHYRDLFTDVVRRMSRSSQRLACEVSGGLDSSAIFAVAENLRLQNKLPAPGIDGYVLDFRDDPDANELEYSRSVGDYLGLPVHEILPSKMPLSWYRERAQRYREFPSYPNGVMGLGIRKEAAGQGRRVLLVGVGGDEWLCGSRSYYAEALSDRQWQTLVSCLDADRKDVGLRRSLWWVFRHGCYPLLPDSIKQLLRMIVMATRSGGIAKHAWLMPSLERVIRARRDQYSPSSRVKARRVGQAEQNLTLSGAYSAHARELEERLAAGLGIELRRPFFDAKLVQFAFATPERVKLRGRTDKLLHRKAMRGLLPESVLKRESKADFMVTFRWHLSEMAEFFSGHVPCCWCNWVETSRVLELYEQSGNPQHLGAPEWKLWTVFGCEAVFSRS